MDDGTIPIRSYRLCFELERRIHQIDRWRIPVPYGIPLRGIGYAAITLLLVLVAQGVPLVGMVVGALHPAVRLVLVPVGVAYGLCQLRVDGRPAHSAGLAWLRHRIAPRRLASFRAVGTLGPSMFGDVAVVADERSPYYRPGVVRGPARVTLRYPANARARGRTLEVTPIAGRPMWRAKRVGLADDQRLVVR